MAPVLRLAVSVDCWMGVAQEADRRVIRLAGRLAFPQVPELLHACEGTDWLQLQLDLKDLVSADVAGIDVLRRIHARGAELLNVPGYIQLKLGSSSDLPSREVGR